MRSRFFSLPLWRAIRRASSPGAALRSGWGLLLSGWSALLLIWPELLPALIGISTSATGVFILTLAWQSWATRHETGHTWPARQGLPRARFIQLRVGSLQRRRWSR